MKYMYYLIRTLLCDGQSEIKQMNSMDEVREAIKKDWEEWRDKETEYRVLKVIEEIDVENFVKNLHDSYRLDTKHFKK